VRMNKLFTVVLIYQEHGIPNFAKQVMADDADQAVKITEMDAQASGWPKYSLNQIVEDEGY